MIIEDNNDDLVKLKDFLSLNFTNFTSCMEFTEFNLEVIKREIIAHKPGMFFIDRIINGKDIFSELIDAIEDTKSDVIPIIFSAEDIDYNKHIAKGTLQKPVPQPVDDEYAGWIRELNLLKSIIDKKRHVATKDCNTDIKGFKSIIVGLGMAGVKLHIKCLQKINELSGRKLFDEFIGIIDTDSEKRNNALNSIDQQYLNNSIQSCSTLSEVKLSDEDKENTIIHICVDDSQHFKVCKEAADAGFKKIIIEKPVAVTIEEVEKMIKLASIYDLRVFVVNNYVYSNALAYCKELIKEHLKIKKEQILYIESELSKDRRDDNMKNRGKHETAFDIEMPHQIAMVLYLTGFHQRRVLRAELTDFYWSSADDTAMCPKRYQRTKNMGSGSIILKLDDTIASCFSSLIITKRIRFLEVVFRSGYKIKCEFPGSGNENYSFISTYTPKIGGHEQTFSDEFKDDLLTKCFCDFYEAFRDNRASYSDLKFNQDILRTILEAKRLAGVL